MVNIKASINKGLSNTLKEAFPGFAVKKIEPISCFASTMCEAGYPKVDGKSINPPLSE